jgi:hypothetical protein
VGAQSFFFDWSTAGAGTTTVGASTPLAGWLLLTTCHAAQCQSLNITWERGSATGSVSTATWLHLSDDNHQTQPNSPLHTLCFHFVSNWWLIFTMVLMPTTLQHIRCPISRQSWHRSKLCKRHTLCLCALRLTRIRAGQCPSFREPRYMHSSHDRSPCTDVASSFNYAWQVPSGAIPIITPFLTYSAVRCERQHWWMPAPSHCLPVAQREPHVHSQFVKYGLSASHPDPCSVEFHVSAKPA